MILEFIISYYDDVVFKVSADDRRIASAEIVTYMCVFICIYNEYVNMIIIRDSVINEC